MPSTNEWMPIGTAPTDGIAILGYMRATERLWVIIPAIFEDGKWLEVDYFNNSIRNILNLTHWMPIPDPPEIFC